MESTGTDHCPPPLLRTVTAMVLLVFCVAGLPLTAEEAPASFYKKETGLFSPRPDAAKPLNTIDRFGPVGIGIELHQPAFVMKVKNVEEGSPAAATGQLKPGQIIESINGETLADIDPRIQLGNIITRAEATDGIVTLRIKDGEASKDVDVTIPVLGEYSDTWPLNCPKSGRIVRNLGDYLAKPGANHGFSGIALLYLLSTGEEKDLELARKWARHRYREGNNPHNGWRLGYGALPLAEYYLRTGDKKILPAIERYAESARATYVVGGWSTRNRGVFHYFNGGRMNAAGLHVCTFLLLAKQCGVDVDEEMLQGALKQFYRFAGRGNVAYGDHRPESGYVDNGKTGALAFTMAAAASLTPGGENSIYARARDVSAIKGFYSTPWMLHGHTGGGIGEIWRGASMGLMVDKRPVKYREFMDNRRWFYELSRRYDGSMCILGGGRYDNPEWGVMMGLSYTIPRKKLVIAGAKSKFGTRYQLPERPWGTKADDMFCSLEPAKDKNGNSPDIARERLGSVDSRSILAKMREKDVSKEYLLTYAHHQDMHLRFAAARRAAGVYPEYLNMHNTHKDLHPELISEFMQSKDPRVRWAGVDAIDAAPHKLLTDERFNILATMITDPREAWFVADAALRIMKYATAEQLDPHVNQLIRWLNHEDWWMSLAALNPLMTLVSDKRHCDKILDAVGAMIASNQRFNRWWREPLLDPIADASDDVKAQVCDMLVKAYKNWPQPSADANIAHPDAEKYFIKRIAKCLARLPGGLDALYSVSQKRYPENPLSHRYPYLHMNEEQRKTNPKSIDVLRSVILNELIPEHLKEHGERIRALASLERKKMYPINQHTGKPMMIVNPGGRNDPIDQLSLLYDRAGIKDYHWKIWGPEGRYDNQWWYHMFRPSDNYSMNHDGPRYRDFELPEGMDNWYAVDFDPGKTGWETALAPFGNYGNKLPRGDRCHIPFCGCGHAETFWDKEILLMRHTFKLPPMQEGYRYRLLVGGQSHVGIGAAYTVYLDGKKLVETTRAQGRYSGGLPDGAFITKDFFDLFEDGEVVVAVQSYLRKMPRSGRIRGHMNAWFEQMNMPPITVEESIKPENETK